MLLSTSIDRSLSAAQLPNCVFSRASLVVGPGGQAHVLVAAADTSARAAAVALARYTQLLGCAVSEVSRDTGVELHSRRAFDLLLAIDAAAGESDGDDASGRLERLDRACGSIAARLAGEVVHLIDGIGVFSRDGEVYTRLTAEVGHRCPGLLPVPCDPRDSIELLAARLGVAVLPARVGEQYALAVFAPLDDWRLYQKRWLQRAHAALANVPMLADLPAMVDVPDTSATEVAPSSAVSSPLAPNMPVSRTPDDLLADLPDSGAAGLFALDLVSAGPDAARTAQLLARAAAMAPERAAQLVAAAPGCVLSGVSAHVIRRVAVTVITGAGADMRARRVAD